MQSTEDVVDDFVITYSSGSLEIVFIVNDNVSVVESITFNESIFFMHASCC